MHIWKCHCVDLQQTTVPCIQTETIKKCTLPLNQTSQRQVTRQSSVIGPCLQTLLQHHGSCSQRATWQNYKIESLKMWACEPGSGSTTTICAIGYICASASVATPMLAPPSRMVCGCQGKRARKPAQQMPQPLYSLLQRSA